MHLVIFWGGAVALFTVSPSATIPLLPLEAIPDPLSGEGGSPDRRLRLSLAVVGVMLIMQRPAGIPVLRVISMRVTYRDPTVMV